MRGEPVGVFEGVPFGIKESFAVKGAPDTWGIPELRNTKTPADSAAVERLEAGGAVLTCGTNLPLNLMDWQSYNAIYGTTNNPWDLSRTPGGSSGGSAAGLTYLSVGSDIGGSLRVPAMFCGVYSHKPTMGLVSTRGQIPGGFAGLHGFSTGLAEAGPMARSARDLAAALTYHIPPILSQKTTLCCDVNLRKRLQLTGFGCSLRRGCDTSASARRPTEEVPVKNKNTLENILLPVFHPSIHVQANQAQNEFSFEPRPELLLSAFNVELSDTKVMKASRSSLVKNAKAHY